MKSKHNLGYIRSWLRLSIYLSVAITTVNAQTLTKEIPITLEITNTAINRVVAHQWANLPQQSWTGNYNGLVYTMNINEPQVILEPNKIKILLKLYVESYVNGQLIYDGELSVSPEVIIPSNTIDLDQLYMEYVNLRNAIEIVFTGIDSRLVDVLVDKLNGIKWVAYAGNIVKQIPLEPGQSYARWTNEADIRWEKIPTLAYQIDSDKLVLTVTSTLSANKPSYVLGLEFAGTDPIYDERYWWDIVVYSNNKIELKHVKVVPFFDNTPPYVRGGELVDYNDNSNFSYSGNTYTFKSYYRFYQDGDETWYNKLKTISFRIKRSGFEKIYHVEEVFSLNPHTPYQLFIRGE